MIIKKQTSAALAKMAFVSLMTSSIVVSGCTTLPGQGPLTFGIENDGSSPSHKDAGYSVVRLSPAAILMMKAYQHGNIPDEFKETLGPNKSITVGIGDSLVVNIWEASPDGLFSTIERKQTALQAVVDEAGMIFIPYVGRVRAAGRSVESLRKAVEEGLQGKAVEPQVQIIVSDNKSSALTVVGDVSSPGQFSVSIRGLRLMDAVALAGGTKESIFESVATINRGSRTATVRMEDVAVHPKNNIWLAPKDSVTVTHQPRTFSAFGAVKSSQLVPFNAEKMMLSEALAQVGGLSDSAADAGGIFVFRFESIDLTRSLKPAEADRLPINAEGKVPVIYRLDFNEPGAFFLSQSFRMRDKDIIYVANHPTAELGKFLSTIVSPLLGTARSASTMGN